MAIRNCCEWPREMPYTELHAHSNFSFLEGASHIEELVLRARTARDCRRRLTRDSEQGSEQYR